MKEVYTGYVYFMFDKFKNFIIGDGGGAVQKLVGGPENLIYGFCNISCFCGILIIEPTRCTNFSNLFLE
jgi:hypothetical protein